MDTTELSRHLIFVLGAPRSGTTLLLRSFVYGQQFTTGVAKESRIYFHRDDPAHVAVDLRYMKAMRATADGCSTALEMFCRSVERQLHETGAQYFAEKTPAHTLVWKELLDIFPHAKMLLIRRDGAAVVHSMVKTKWQTVPTDRLPIVSDINAVKYFGAIVKLARYERYCRQIESHDQSLVVRYEDVVQQTIDTRKVFSDWLGVPLGPLYVGRPHSGETSITTDAPPDARRLDRTRLTSYRKTMPAWAIHLAHAIRPNHDSTVCTP